MSKDVLAVLQLQHNQAFGTRNFEYPLTINPDSHTLSMIKASRQYSQL